MPMGTTGEKYTVWLCINEMEGFQSGLTQGGGKKQNERKGTSLPQHLAMHSWVLNQMLAIKGAHRVRFPAQPPPHQIIEVGAPPIVF